MGHRVAPVNAAASLIPHVPAAAIVYQRSLYILGFFGLFWGLLALWLLLETRLSARLRNTAYRLARLRVSEHDSIPPFRVVFVYFVLYSLLVNLWSLPIGLADLALEHHYGFSRQSLAGFLRDYGTSFCFNLLLVPLIWLGYRLYRWSPQRWWLWLWALMVPLLLFEFVLQPVVLAPAYNRFTPLASGPLRDHILALAARAGISGAHVFVSDTSRRTTHVNAYVTGIGPTTRIVLNDTALRLLPEDQILAMVGHEMGHYVEGHIWIQFFSSVLGGGVFLWFAARLLPWMLQRWKARWSLFSLTDVATLPMLSLVLHLFLLIQLPIANGESRYLEHRADTFGLRVTGLNLAMARLMVGFAERDYTDPDPPAPIQFWFGTHPSLKERIDFARRYPHG